MACFQNRYNCFLRLVAHKQTQMTISGASSQESLSSGHRSLECRENYNSKQQQRQPKSSWRKRRRTEQRANSNSQTPQRGRELD